MGILQLPYPYMGQSGLIPDKRPLATTDNLATVTAAGYLNYLNLEGFPLNNNSVIEILYSYNQQTNSGTFGIFTVNISNGVISLTEWINPGNVLLPVVSGNLASFNGVTGQIQDSGISAASVAAASTQLGQLQQSSVTLTPAQVIAAFATPQVLIPAAAGKVAIVHSANVYTASTGNTAYATGTAPIIQYGTTIHGAGTSAVGAGLVTGDIEAAASQVRTLGPTASTAWTGITNTAVTFSCATAYTAGTGTNITFTLVYELITATV